MAMKRATGPATSSRATPRRSVIAVRTMSTRESGSSTQSTGTSCVRSPRRWASTSSSVSKNQPSSRTSSSSPSSTSRRAALKPHWASEKRARSDGAQDPVVAARDELALRAAHDPRAVREPRADGQVAVAGHQRRDEREQPAQVRREVDVHVADDLRRARRPGGAQRAAAALLLEPQVPHATGASARAARAISGVASTLALSAITIRQLNGKPSLRKRCSRRMLRSRPAASL